jgi:hypothetical protein
MTNESKLSSNLTAEERVVLARHRFKEAAVNTSLVPKSLTKPLNSVPTSVWLVAALLGGFLLSYSPRLRQAILSNANEMLRISSLMKP